MKKRMFTSLVVLAFILTINAYSQGFVETAEQGTISTFYNNSCILKLASGEEIQGKFAGGVYVNNGFSRVSVKLENGEKAKFMPEQIASMQIKTSELMRLTMISEASSSIKEMVKTDFNAIVNRDYIIFETELTPKKTDTRRLLQLLNPGFDSKIKVFAEPGKQTGSLSVGELQLTGGEDRAYLFVKNGEKAIQVKKGSYSENFNELYSDCPQMLESFKDQKIKWEDVALHVYVYDQLCK
ncbi:MAG: hypothetical protein IQL11_09605 [Bacteroidales bacterium]|nr:hypothetical protein [Bacteroidales bacterium]